MNFKKISLIGAIGMSALVLSACSKAPASTSSTNNNSQSSTANAVTVDYSSGGFSPASVNVKVGQQVVFNNSSSGNVQVNSDPHPTHTLFPELNLGTIASGQTKSASFTKAGTYTYHNHLNASQKGTIVVQ